LTGYRSGDGSITAASETATPANTGRAHAQAPPSLSTDDRVRHRLANFPNTARKYPLDRCGEVLSILLTEPGLASLTLTEVNPRPAS